MPRDAVVAQLQQLGMSGYEAKAYVALVVAGEPITGYEVAKRSGVPRSMVYETLGKLVTRGAAFEVRGDGEATAYLALPAESLLARLRRDFEDSVEALGQALPALLPVRSASLLHNLHGRRAVVERARDLVEGAREEVDVSLWSEDAGEIVPLLAAAHDRGVEVLMMAFGDVPEVGHTFRHEFSAPEIVLDRVGCRLLVLAVDRREVLIAGGLGDDVWGVYADDPAVVLVAVEYIRHDIAMQVLVNRIGRAEVEEFWPADPVLVRLATGRAMQRDG